MKHESLPGRRYQSGMSLIELMIALLIGTILIVGMVQVFGASRSAYQLSQGIARNQESARFALDFLGRDLRMAGHAGCVNDQSLLATDSTGTNVIGGNIRSLFLDNTQRAGNDVAALPFPLRFDMAIQGFEANGTAPGSAVTLSTTPTVGTAAGWSPNLPAALAGLSPIAGSDIVVLRYLSADEAPVQWAPGSPTTISYPTASSGVATGGNGLFALTDCNAVAVFQTSTTPTTTGMTVSTAGLNKSGFDPVAPHDEVSISNPNATLYRAESIAYYVALNPQNVPALYRARWTTAPGSDALTVVAEEMVEGVESLQLLYGEDANSENLALLPSGHITKTNTAATIDAGGPGRWRRVGAVQLGMMVRGGGEERAASMQATAPQHVLQVAMTAPNDGHYRSVYETTLAVRNRLFGN